MTLLLTSDQTRPFTLRRHDSTCLPFSACSSHLRALWRGRLQKRPTCTPLVQSCWNVIASAPRLPQRPSQRAWLASIAATWGSTALTTSTERIRMRSGRPAASTPCLDLPCTNGSSSPHSQVDSNGPRYKGMNGHTTRGPARRVPVEASRSCRLHVMTPDEASSAVGTPLRLRQTSAIARGGVPAEASLMFLASLSGTNTMASS